MTNRISYLVLFVLLASCSVKDRGHYHFYGNVTEKITGAPVPGALMKVLEDYDDGSIQRGEYGNVYTDHHGDYVFYTDIRHRNEKSVALVSSSPSTGINGKSFGGIKEENHIDLQVNSQCYLVFHIVNQNPFDQDDLLFDVYFDRPRFNQYVIEGNPMLTGTSVDRIDTTSFFGYESHILYYSIRKNGITYHASRTIYTPDPYSAGTIHDSIFY